LKDGSRQCCRAHCLLIASSLYVPQREVDVFNRGENGSQEVDVSDFAESMRRPKSWQPGWSVSCHG
ncbi:MAG TPA: hypothetical protein VKB96_06950, partial [Gammaproteobacteria bacterium]|nr:hypothetical protein [Gammaproteobacteria bacterium]